MVLAYLDEAPFACEAEPTAFFRVRPRNVAGTPVVQALDVMTVEPPDRDQRRPAKRPDEEGMKKSEDAAFDRWLNRQLHKVYDPVLGEPLPADIQSLLDQFDDKDTTDE